MPTQLDYASHQTLYVVRSADGSVTITVPTRRSLGSFCTFVAASDLFGVLLVPLAALIFLLLATKKPRAVLMLRHHELSISETDDHSLGLISTRRSWPLNEIGFFRPNRFNSGIFMTITGKDCFDLLTDIPPCEIAGICELVDDYRKVIAG